MHNEDCHAKLVREVHDLRILLVLLMHIRAEDTMGMNDSIGWDATHPEELQADWDDLASSLPKHQWLVGVRAFDHVADLDLDAERIRPHPKKWLSNLYWGYSHMRCTDYSPPRMMSPRFLKNGLSHIRNEFEFAYVPSDAQKQLTRCDKQGEQALSHEGSAVDIGHIGGL